MMCLLSFALLGAAWAYPDTTCSGAMSSVDIVKQRHYDLVGKTVVMTGGNTGIGFGAAMGMATAGAKLVFLAHNTAKMEAAARNITRDTGNADIKVLPVDLASFTSIRQTATTVLNITSQIDVLVLDAGQNYEIPGHEISKDGFEQTFQVTFLGHFLLTELLLPAIRSSTGRVVHAGCDSNGFKNTSYQILVPEDETVCKRSDASPNCTDVSELPRLLRKPLPSNQSTHAFLAHFMKTFHARDLSARPDGVPAYVAHPGIVDTPGLPVDRAFTDGFCPYPMAWYACNCWSDNATRAYDSSVCPLSPLRGGNTLGFLATAPFDDLRESKGHFFAACEVQRAPIDQFSSMEEVRGTDGAAAYAQSLTTLWRGLTGLDTPSIERLDLTVV